MLKQAHVNVPKKHFAGISQFGIVVFKHVMDKETQICLRGIQQSMRVNGHKLQQGKFQLDGRKNPSQQGCWMSEQVSQRDCRISTLEDSQNSTKLQATWGSFEVSHAWSRGFLKMISKVPFHPKLVCYS